MPVKNAAPYIRVCIQSIINQSFTNWELIAVDDSSSDESYQILAEFAKDHANIQVYKSAGEGITEALRTAYNYCSGDMIHRMDADDIMPLNKLNLLMEKWRPGSIVTGKVQYFTDEGEIGDGFNKYQQWINSLMDSNNLWKDPYLECSLPSPAWLLSKNDFERIGAFNSEWMPEDYDLMFRVYQEKINVVCIPEIVHLWRDSENRTSRNEKAYFPISYFPLKVHYFLKIDRTPILDLVLWGAGKKGKIIARLLIEKNQKFIWITDNQQKSGKSIYGVRLKSTKDVDLETFQVIVAVSSPTDKIDIKKALQVSKNQNHFWFC